MTQKIVFEFESEGFWSEDDQETLKAALYEAARDIDSDDFVDGSEELFVKDVSSNENASPVSDEVKKQIIGEFVANSQVEFQVQARFRDEDGKTVGDSVAATGFLS